MQRASSARVRFGDFELHLISGELSNGSGKILLQQQPLQILRMLIEREGEPVTREEIKNQLWPSDTIVEFDQSINAVIRNLRKALGDSADQPIYIETLARRGYRLKTPVEWIADSSEEVLPVGEGAAARRQPEPSLIGHKVSHYRVLEVIGGGGMGMVYKAEDLKLGRQVALKFLPPELATDPPSLQRFEREARAASSLDHPGICTIHQVEEYEGQPFIVMQLLKGETLRDRLAALAAGQQSMAIDHLLDIALQACDGLRAAHERGVIHRDIKPANIFLTTSGQVKILDFGLAKLVSATEEGPYDSQPNDAAAASQRARSLSLEESLTQFGVAVGTAGYMSPEQIRGETLDARTDIFSFGLVLYEMATGHRAFNGETVALLHDAILTATPIPAHELNSAVPPSLEKIIGKSLEKYRELRYQTATEMRADLQRLKRETEGDAAVGSSAAGNAPDKPTTGKKLWPIVAGAALVITAGLVAGWLYHRSDRAPKLTEKDTIVIADFDNKTGDTVFDDTLKTALTVALNQSPFLNVLSDSRVADTLKLMTRSPVTQLTPNVAREVCQRSDSTAYIAGSIVRLGSEYVIELKAVNCQSGDTLTEEQATAQGKENVVNSLGQAATKLRAKLGESLATVQKFDVPLAEATTSSLEALQAFSLFSKAEGERGTSEAMADLQRAIQLDPNFAMAYLVLGDRYSGMGEVQRGSEYISKAFELRDHASEHEKLLISGEYYQVVTGELDKAAQTYQATVESYPRDAFAAANLGSTYAQLGQYERALEVTPQLPQSFGNQAMYLIALRRFEEARSIVQRAHSNHLDGSVLRNVAYGIAFLSGDSQAMNEQQQWFESRSAADYKGLSLRSDTAAYAGQLRKAQELSHRGVESAIRADSKEYAAILRENEALREAATGDLAPAREAAAAGMQLAPESQAVNVEAALAYAFMGDNERAQSMARDLNKRYPLDTQVQTLWLSAIEAQLALNRNNASEAIKDLQSASPPVEQGMIMFMLNLSCLYPTYVRGQTYLAAGQGKEATAEFQKIVDHNGLVWNCWTGALARLGVARANALEAKNSTGTDSDAARARAVAAYKGFLTLWIDADPDIPIYQQAKAEYSKLQ